MDTFERMAGCPDHHPPVAISSIGSFLCGICKRDGWIQTGRGGVLHEKLGLFRSYTYWKTFQLNEHKECLDSLRELTKYCDDHNSNPENATLNKMPTFMGSRGANSLRSDTPQWCFEWADMYDYESHGPSDKEKPSRIFKDGHTEWCWHSKLHRDSGPAVTTSDGTEYYFKDGERTDKEGQPFSTSEE